MSQHAIKFSKDLTAAAAAFRAKGQSTHSRETVLREHLSAEVRALLMEMAERLDKAEAARPLDIERLIQRVVQLSDDRITERTKQLDDKIEAILRQLHAGAFKAA